jgi:murein DD-endopeptidase MepM/ murein hydrolase activator NlpD
MSLGTWWRRRTENERLAIALGLEASLVVGIIVAARNTRASRLTTWVRPLRPLQNLLGFDSEESDEEEPPGIVYDEVGPCRTTPHPWSVPEAVSSPGPLVGSQGEEYCVPPADLEPDPQTDVAFAEGGSRPQWPLATEDPHKLEVSYKDVRGLWHGNWARRFGASRTTTVKETGETYKRNHVGIDLFADPGDLVLVPEDGEVIAALPFYEGTGAVYIRTDSGVVVNLGEVQEGSWKKFGIRTGDLSANPPRVLAGQPIAIVGRSDEGSHMLHFETYDDGVTVDAIRHKKMQWRKGDPAPQHILDPSRYLVRAQRVRYEQLA